MATYFVKPPGKGRKSFAIVRRADGKSPQVSTPALTALNKRLEQGEDFTVIRDLVHALKDQLAASERPRNDLLADNIRLGHRYLTHIGPRIELNKDANTARRDVWRAIEACGSEMIDCVDPRAIQTRINRLYKGDAQRRVVRALNGLLKYLHKDFRLIAAKKGAKMVKYITIDEFEEKAGDLPPRLRALFGSLFGTGCRMGEAFSLRHLVKGSFVDVSLQRTQKQEVRAPKTGNGRKAAVLPELRAYVREWLLVPEEARKAMRLRFEGKHLSTWTRDLWGIRAHDLRHSYAVCLAERGASVTQIARNLGNSEAVVREYYLPYIQTDPEMDAMERLLIREG